MLVNTTRLNGLRIQATDGELGTVEQFYFDDETWGIRYLIVDTGGWLGGRRVLISPLSILTVDWQAGTLNVGLTKKQVQDSPDIDTHLPVSRQYETEYLGYYGYPYYWNAPYYGDPGYASALGNVPMNGAAEVAAEKARRGPADYRLRSAEAVTGYHVEASNGEIGHVDGFVVDDDTWSVRYIEVATRNWWPGKKVLVSPAWIERISWLDSKFFTALSREDIQGAPEYMDGVAITREYENRLYFHYGQAPYWAGIEHRAAEILIGV